MTDVDDPWAAEVDVRYLTDTDLQASRTANTKVSDTSGELHRLVETLRRVEGLDTWSETCDRALRVEIAALIDAKEVFFERDDHDVAYTIPPAGWVREKRFPLAGDVSADEVGLAPEDEVDTSERAINFSTPQVVYDMAKQTVDEGPYDTLTDLVRHGVERLLGRV